MHWEVQRTALLRTFGDVNSGSVVAFYWSFISRIWTMVQSGRYTIASKKNFFDELKRGDLFSMTVLKSRPSIVLKNWPAVALFGCDLAVCPERF
jgi:hypothetical protein